MAVTDDELSAMAIEELDQACSLIWPELVKITPWGDSFVGIAPSGREVEVERRYLWSNEPGGGVVVEVEVRDPLARQGGPRSRCPAALGFRPAQKAVSNAGPFFPPSDRPAPRTATGQVSRVANCDHDRVRCRHRRHRYPRLRPRAPARNVTRNWPR